MSNQKPNNLKEFLTKHEVEIPMLQREYAQGRESQHEVADRFLKAIFEVLEKDGGSLHLDFIYGYVEGKNSAKKLILIDGQQRITTLWLLHFYIYARAGRLDEKAKKWLGKFSYSVRESSKEFCENLLKNDFCTQDSPKEIIYDKASEFVKNGDLDNDPTIKAMIHMLDRIHDKFEGSRVEFFKSEVNNKLEKICEMSEDSIRLLQDFLNNDEWKDDSKVFGCLIDKLDKITFDFFDMGQFKLGEELYVKMNARGKQLSDYENLKAGIEEGLKRKSADRERFESLTQNIDSHWSDYFGGFREKSLDIEKFDERGRNFLHYGAVYFYCKDSKDKGDKSESKEVVRRLREQSIDEIIEQLSSLEKMEVLDRAIGVLSNLENFVEGELDLKGLKDLKSVKFFDSKSEKDDDKDEKDAIGRIKVCYFFLILSYMEHRTLGEIGVNEVSKAQFYDYLCVGRHLIENHPLNEAKNVLSFVVLFRFLAQTGKGSVYEIMRDLERPIDNPSNPFHKNVYPLEVRKAGLIAQSRQGGKPWEGVLSKTSKNPFLIGWVDFLLDFSDESFEGYKDKQEEYGNPDFDRFKRYAALTMGILSDEFLGKGGEQGEESEKDEEDKKKRLNLALFQRAWLSIEDYGFCSTHWFYGNRQKGVYRNREAWNNLLGGKHFKDKKQLENEKHPLYFKAFLEKLNKGVGREITTEALCNAMREMVDEAIGNSSWSQKSWWEQLLIRQEGHFDFVNENKDRFQKACRLRFFDEKQNRIDGARRGDKAQAIKVELLQKTDNIKGVLDLLDYGFYLYCKEKFNLSEEYNKDNKLSEYGASESMTSRFKLEGHEVYCNSMNCSRTREGKRDIPESSIAIGEKFYEINLNEDCDVFAEFERVLEEARNDGVLRLAKHEG